MDVFDEFNLSFSFLSITNELLLLGVKSDGRSRQDTAIHSAQSSPYEVILIWGILMIPYANILRFQNKPRR